MTSTESLPRVAREARPPAARPPVPARPIAPALRAQWRELQRGDRYGRFGGR